MRFAPDAVTVRAGETIAFEVTNAGAVRHELVIGDEVVQQEHEPDMRARRGDGHAGTRTPDAVDVAPGQTARPTYTFKEPGTLLFGCHIPGHYSAGMRGSISVTAS